MIVISFPLLPPRRSLPLERFSPNLSTMDYLQNARLADQTSWLVGGNADYLCFPKTEAEVEEAVRFAIDRKIPWSVLGGGTNVLVSDAGVEGLVINLRRFSGAQISETDDRLTIDCLAGTGKSELLKIFLKAKLAPALFLAGLPGDVGGGVVMNAGVAEAFAPREFHEIIESIDVLKVEGANLRRQTYRRDEIRWSYRHTEGWQPGIILRARISWPKQIENDILNRVREANKSRLSKQPLDMPSCGSTFVNPPGHKAAQLIDQSGLKGFQIGGAQVSTKHANFIVNLGTSTAKDIEDVIAHVKDTVKLKSGVDLKTEVIKLGR